MKGNTHYGVEQVELHLHYGHCGHVAQGDDHVELHVDQGHHDEVDQAGNHAVGQLCTCRGSRTGTRRTSRTG